MSGVPCSAVVFIYVGDPMDPDISDKPCPRSAATIVHDAYGQPNVLCVPHAVELRHDVATGAV